MLTKDPQRLAALVRSAESARDDMLERLRMREQLALGAMSDEDLPEQSPENLAMSLFTLITPLALTRSAGVTVRSSGGYEMRRLAAAGGSAVTQIARVQRMEKALRPCLWDYMFKGYACGFIEKSRADMSDLTEDERRALNGRLADGFKDRNDHDTKSPVANDTPREQIPARWPRIKWLDPHKCGFDSHASSLAEARFTWHEVTCDHEDLIDRAAEHSDDWIDDAVLDMTPLSRAQGGNSSERDEVRYYVVYVPGGVLDDAPPEPYQPGIIHTIAAQTDASGGIEGMEIRRPYYWSGHPGGPHIFEGQMVTGVSPFFLGTLAASEDALSMVDAVTGAVKQAILNKKRVYAYDPGATEEMQDVASAADGEFVPVSGVQNGVIQEIVTGGMDNIDGASLQVVMSSAARGIGLDESGQGLANRDATATASSIAANATATRLGALLDSWNNGFVRECFERMLWEVLHDDRVVVRLDDRGKAASLGAQLDFDLGFTGPLDSTSVQNIVQGRRNRTELVEGGDGRSMKDFDWASLELRIQAHSTEGIHGEQQFQRLAIWSQQLAQIGALMVQQPHIRWIDVLTRMAEALGIEEVEAIADIQKAQELAQMQLLAQSQPQELAGQSPDIQGNGATLRESRGGARSPAGVDPGSFQLAG